MDYGMSVKLPNRVLGNQSDQVFVGRDMAQSQGYSEDVAKVIDEEVAALIAEAADRAAETIRTHRTEVDKIAKKLVKDEVIDKDEFIELVGPRPAKPKKDDPREPGAPDQEIGPDITGSPAAA